MKTRRTSSLVGEKEQIPYVVIDPTDDKVRGAKRNLLLSFLSAYPNLGDMVPAGKTVFHYYKDRSKSRFIEIELSHSIVCASRYNNNQDFAYFIADGPMIHKNELMIEFTSTKSLMIDLKRIIITNQPAVNLVFSKLIDVEKLSSRSGQLIAEELVNLSRATNIWLYKAGMNVIAKNRGKPNEVTFYLIFHESFLIRKNSHGNYKFEVIKKKLGNGSHAHVYAIKTHSLTIDGIKSKRDDRIVKILADIKDAKIEYDLSTAFPEKGSKKIFILDPNRLGHTAYIEKRFEGSKLADLICDIKITYSRPYFFNTDTALLYTRNLIRGLRKIHQAGIIHQDIKPNNIIVSNDSDGNAKIIDFNLARWKELRATTKSIEPHYVPPGNYYYGAPELWNGQFSSESSDIYSLGLSLAELWGADSIMEKVIEIMRTARRNRVEDLDKNIIIKNLANGEKNFNNLFCWQNLEEDHEKLDVKSMKAIRLLLESMTAINPDNRVPLDKAEEIINEIILKRKCHVLSNKQKESFNKAYHLINELLKKIISIENNKMGSLFYTNAKDPSILFDFDGIFSSIKSITHAEHLKMLADMLGIKPIKTLTLSNLPERIQDEFLIFNQNILMFKSIISKLGDIQDEHELSLANNGLFDSVQHLVSKFICRYENSCVSIENIFHFNSKFSKFTAEYASLLHLVGEEAKNNRNLLTVSGLSIFSLGQDGRESDKEQSLSVRHNL